MSENSNLKIALNNAIDLFNNNNLNECLQQLEEILIIHPSNPEALSLALDINIKISNTEKAIEIINKLIQIDPTKISYYEKNLNIQFWFSFFSCSFLFIPFLSSLMKSLLNFL